MCHEYYEAWWRKAESTAKQKTEAVKPDVIATVTPQPDEKARPRPERAVEKELVPAE